MPFQVLVPNEAKDSKYWSRRQKNNLAARRSREARRLKENQIALRAAFLEKENVSLKDTLEKLEQCNISISKDIDDLNLRIRQHEERLEDDLAGGASSELAAAVDPV